ncbi:hypothetical protein P4V41_07895 [Fictibacillus nanhaiensis]|uniref:hypothetical protein n=1 Tax=Fictibacillus nanhaiensis TaxID=742169 RepID=UPI002E1B0CF6|nr:hypothetical protein [Fictibacillus nanhaiensis]
MRQLRITNKKVEDILTQYLTNIGYEVVGTFSHVKGVTVDVFNEDVFEEFEKSLVEEEDYH